MKETLLSFFQQHPDLALAASLLLSVVIAVLGVVPSFFVTAANILFFGFWPGVAVSFVGEALGAVVSFYLYRKGFKKGVGTRLEKYRAARALLTADDRKAFWLVFSLRLLPLVPSGLVTFAAAVGRVSAVAFVLSSSLGKLPALLLEGYAVYEVTRFGTTGKIILAAAALAILYVTIRGTGKKNP